MPGRKAKSMVTIQKLAETDIPAVVEIHQDQFPRARSTRLGRPFVHKMYCWFLEAQPELALVARDGGQPVGFIVGAIGGYGRRIFRYAFPQAVLGMLRHPGLVLQKNTFTMWKSYARAFAPNQSAASTQGMRAGNRASLSSIAVAQSAQRKGVARALMAEFEASARRLAVERLDLSVGRENRPARHLYESCGWQPVEHLSAGGSVNYQKLLETAPGRPSANSYALHI
ncbi:MAG: GNAT family N-acetyltransferase [Anaerolineales bacterium]|nr:GNAT family N-acetyltransferase [Anaerolineales bacterium]